MMQKHYTELYEYNRWACDLTAASLETIPNLEEAERARTPEQGRGPLAIFSHMASAGLIWLMRLNRQGSVDLPLFPDWEFEEARENSLSCCLQLVEFVQGVPKGGFGEAVTYQNSSGKEFTNTIGDILDHVHLHYHYHRGQLAMLVKRGGGEPAATDFIFYKRREE